MYQIGTTVPILEIRLLNVVLNVLWALDFSLMNIESRLNGLIAKRYNFFSLSKWMTAEIHEK